VKNLDEYVKLARTKPGAMAYGTSGIGGTGHLSGALMESIAKIDLTHVPYKGGGPAMADLLGNQVQSVFASAPSAVPQIKSGKILCTLEKQTLKMAPFVVSDEGHIQRAPREKTIRPKECGFYHIQELKAFAKDVTGQDFPAEAKKKDPMCMYLSLAARTPSERIFWVQPEIWAVLSTPEFAGQILSKLKAGKTDRE
jgi:hypothetical protein